MTTTEDAIGGPGYDRDFAKLFQIRNRQILVYIQPSGDDDGATLHQIYCWEGIYIDLKLTFDNEDKAHAAFDKIDEASATALLNTFEKLVGTAS